MPDTYFPQQSSGATAAAGQEFVKDSFSDYTLAATNNGSLTSTVSTNPLNDYFDNTDAPRYEAKTLWIKDLVVEEDRSKWDAGGKTYRIIFQNPDPNFKAYASGNVLLEKFTDKAGVVLASPNSLVGISGVVRKIGFICGTSMNTGTARLYIDNAFVSSLNYGNVENFAVAYSNEAPDCNVTDVFKYNLLDSGTMQSNDIHNYEIRTDIQAAQATPPGGNSALVIFGIVVYVENAAANIQCPAGVSYIDKSKVTSTSGVTLSVPAQNASLFHLGAKTSFFKTNAGTWGASTFQVPLLQTQATGLSGTNLFTTSLNQGQSFPIGTGIAVQTGALNYIGWVTNQSSDTLTVFPTLSFGLNGATLTKAFYFGQIQSSAGVLGNSTTISASLYQKAWSWDPVTSFGASQFPAQNASLILSGGGGSTGAIWMAPFVDQQRRFMVEPISANGLTTVRGFVSQVDGIAGWNGALRISGDFQALEFEIFNGLSGSMQMTATIDGSFLQTAIITAGTTTLTQAHFYKLPVVSDLGIGWHTLRWDTAVGTSRVVITKVNGYKYIGPSMAPGVMATQEQLQTFIDFGITPDRNFWGTKEVVPASNLYLKNGWDTPNNRGAGTVDINLLSSFKGYFLAQGLTSSKFASSNSQMNFNFYGNKFCVHGTLFTGGSYITTLNGASVGVVFNQVFTGVTEGFNALQVSRQTGTLIISAVSYGKTYYGIHNAQNTQAIPQLLDFPGSQIRENSIDVRRAAKRYAGPSVGIGGFALGDISNNATISFAGTTFLPIPGAVAIQTSGNPVAIGLMYYAVPTASNANQSAITFVNVGTGGNGNLFITRHMQQTGYTPTMSIYHPATALAVSTFTYDFAMAGSGIHELAFPASCLNNTDFCPAGAYTYRLGMSSSSASMNIFFNNIRLFAYEIF